MNTYARQGRDGGARTGGGRLVKTDGGGAATRLGDERPQVVAQLALGEEQNGSPEVLSLARQRQMLDASPRVAAQAKLAATLSGFAGASESAQALQRQTEVEEEEEDAAPAGGEVTQRQTGEGEDAGPGGGLLATTKGVASGLLSGTPTGDVGVDAIIKLIRSQVSVPEWRTAVEKGLALLDQKYVVPTAGGWLWSKAPDLLKSLVPLGANFVSGLTLLRAAFHVLPAPIQTLILYFVASRLRKFLSLLEGKYLSGEQIDSAIEWLFVDDPVSALEKVYVWVGGLVKSPLAFLFNYFTGGGPTAAEQPTDEGGADLPAATTGEGGGPEQSIERRAESGLDTLFALNLDVVKLDVGKPRLKRRERKTTTPVERPGGEAASQEAPRREGEVTGPEARLEESLMPGGLSLPFNFSVNLFGRELRADQTNELIMPWAGGLYLNVPRAVLDVNAGLEGIFQLRSVVIEPLVVTEKGLESLGLYLEGLDFAGNVVKVEQLGGRWSRGKGVLFRGDVTVEAMGHAFAGRLILQLDSAGGFQFASVVIMSPDDFAIVPNTLTLTSPKFSGSVKKGAGVSLAFGGNLGLAVEGVKLSTSRLLVAYDKTFGAGGGFNVSADNISLDVGGLALTILRPQYDSRARALHADLAALRFGKGSEEPKRESDWLKTQTTENEFDWLDLLKVAPSVEWAIPDIWLRQDSPHLKMGKPRVAVISLNAFGLEAGLDFNKRTGSLKGALGYEAKIPVVSLPIPILPGLEAFVDLDVFAGVGGRLAGSLAKPEQDESPWHVEGAAGLGGHVGARLSAGVQVGSQLLAALAVGLYAQGRGDIKADARLRGGMLLKTSRILPADADPMKAEYEFAAAIKAEAGLVVKAKVLHVIQRTLYQRSFKQWDMGSYNVKGAADWTGEGWKSVKAAGSFDGGKPNAPAADDRQLPAEESRALLLEVGRAVAGGAELRRDLVLKVVEEYKRKDIQVYEQLDEASQTLAGAVAERSRLKGKFLGSIRYGEELEELQTKIPEYRRIVEGLKSQYLEILTVLVNVEKAINTVADSKLDLGTYNLTALLRQVYAEAARMEDAERRWAQVKPEVGSVERESSDRT